MTRPSIIAIFTILIVVCAFCVHGQLTFSRSWGKRSGQAAKCGQAYVNSLLKLHSLIMVSFTLPSRDCYHVTVITWLQSVTTSHDCHHVTIITWLPSVTAIFAMHMPFLGRIFSLSPMPTWIWRNWWKCWSISCWNLWWSVSYARAVSCCKWPMCSHALYMIEKKQQLFPFPEHFYALQTNKIFFQLFINEQIRKDKT